MVSRCRLSMNREGDKYKVVKEYRIMRVYIIDGVTSC
jgi:hypothetical protein